MRKPKVACFRYKKHNDVYISNVSFSTDILLALIDCFPELKLVILIEADENSISALSLIGKNMGIVEEVTDSRIPRFSLVCSKTELRCLLKQIDLDNFEGMFMASVNNNIMPKAVIYSLGHTANTIVQNGISDISISINFLESEMVISLSKGKYEAMSIKDKICSFWGD